MSELISKLIASISILLDHVIPTLQVMSYMFFAVWIYRKGQESK